MKWLKTSFSSKLNFSLTKKRLALIGKNTSASSLYFKALPVLIAFAFSPFLFFDQKEGLDEPGELTFQNYQDYWDSKNLEGGFRAVEFSSAIDGIAYKATPVLYWKEGDNYFETKIPYQPIPIRFIYNEDRMLFSGTQKFVNRINGQVGWENIYEDGVLAYSKYYADSLINVRGVVFTYLFFDDNGNMEQREYNANNDLLYQHVLTQTEYRYFGSKNELLSHSYTTEIDGNSWTYNKWWYPDGQLSSEWARDTLGIQGLMTIYDENGEITFQTRYKDGRLIERIK